MDRKFEDIEKETVSTNGALELKEKEVDKGDENCDERKAKKKIMTSKNVKILVAVVYGNLFLGSCYALMAPIFPAEAERKNASATAYGFVFGIYQLFMFLSSPIYGKIIIFLKPGFMMKAGMLVSGVCTILFGFLHYAPPGPYFLSLAFVIRAVDALGASCFLTASYATLGSVFPEIIGRAMSITETAFAFGLAGGPVLGGALYELGGFTLPFLVVGGLLLTGTTVNMFLFSDEADVPLQPANARKIILNFDFIIDALAIASCFGVIGFNEATLEPHIRQFNLTPTIIGVIFLIAGIIDALVAPIWGYLAEKVHNAQVFILVGSLLFAVYFLIIGPVPFLHFQTTLWVVIFVQFLFGIGMSAVIVCTFTHGMKHTVERGFPDDVSTYGLISGVLFSAACFGAFIGPSFGGFLIDQVGYKSATAIVAGTEICVSFLFAFRLIILCLKKNKKDDDKNTQS